MPVIRFFAAAREAAGTDRAELDGATVGDVVDEAVARYGAGLGNVVHSCKIWVNGEPATRADAVSAADEVALLPPVSGGA